MSIWSRLLIRKSASFELRKKPALVNPKPQLLQLEDRVVPAGNLVAFVVDGLGGYELKRSPAGTPILDYLNGINSGIGNSLTGTYVYTPDWNSPDSTNTSPDAGYFDVGIKINNNNDLGINLPSGIDIDVSMGIGGPKDFISDLSNWLEKYTTQQDTVVLIGHSLGGNSILEAAKQTKAEIDFLVTIDPVGFSPEPESATFKANLAGGFLGQLVNFQKTFKNSDFVAPIDDIGYPGSRKNLSIPGSNTKYFMNRWQTGYVFPMDHQYSGALSAETPISKFGIAENRDASVRREANGNEITHSGNYLDWLSQHTHPTIDGNILNGFKFHLDDVNLNSHSFYRENYWGGDSEGITTDPLIVSEFKTVMEGIIPQLPVVNAGPDFFNIKEGDTLNIKNATATDSNIDDVLSYKWQCSSFPPNVKLNDIIINNETTLNPSFNLPDNGVYTFVLSVSDGSDTVMDDITVSVDNVSPTVTVTNVPTIVSQFNVFFGVNIFDPGLYDAPSVTVDYGDGQTDTNLPASGPFRHTYQTPGTYTINITATDKDRGVGTATQQVTVKSFGIVTNPNGGGDMLAVGGTPGVDEVHLNTLDGETFSGTINGEVIGPIVVSTHAVSIRTGAGKDFVALGVGQGKNAIPTKVNVDMGPGNDKFASFSQTAGASARTLGNGLYQYSYFGGGNAYVAVIGNETPIIEPNVDDSYVAALYHKLLERNPSKAEVKVWSKQFARETYEYIAHNIFYSVERSSKTVNNWYKTYLGRTPSQAEAQPWVSLIVAGKNEEQILSKFLGSKESIARQGSGTAFINSLYNHFLGRNASQAAINSWFRDYGNPPNYYEVAKAILTSKEYQTREITSYYDRFMDRHQGPVSGFASAKAFSRQGIGPREVSDWIFANVSPHAARYQMLWSPEFIKNGL